MRVLVTGGAGYIGSVTTRWLAQTGHQPIVLDDLSTGHRAAVCDGAALVIGSIDDRALVRQLVERESIEAVIHLAARSLVQESLRDPLGYHETNVAGSISLLQA